MVQTYGYFCMLVSLPIEVDEWKKHQTYTSKKKKKKVYANVSQICSPFTALFCLFIPSFSFLILTNNSSLTPRVRTRHSHFYRRGFFPRVKNAFSLTKHSFSLWQALFTFLFWGPRSSRKIVVIYRHVSDFWGGDSLLWFRHGSCTPAKSPY